MIFSTESPRPVGTVEVDGVSHDVWSQYDIGYADVEAFERVIPRLVTIPKALTPELGECVVEFLACVIPTLARGALMRMQPRRLLGLYLTVLPKVLIDPFEAGRLSSEATSTVPPSKSTTPPSGGASRARTGGRTKTSIDAPIDK